MVQVKKIEIPHPIAHLLQEGHISPPAIEMIRADQAVALAYLEQDIPAASLFVADAASMHAASSYLPLPLLALPALIFPTPAKPRMEQEVAALLSAITTHQPEHIVVVGSGSLSDIGKYAAAEHRLPLTIFATAPSMNGYTSITASLLESGMKHSHRTVMPQRVIVIDEMIRAAPLRMIEAGHADSLASMSADCDWQLSHLLTGTPYHASVWDAQRPYFSKVLDTSGLMELLLLQGLCMSAAGSSAPASGGEHMLAHLAELVAPEPCAALLHGELIAITHFFYQQYQQHLLQSSATPQLRPLPSPAWMEQYIGQPWHAVAPHYHEKAHWHQQHAEAINAKLAREWPAIRTALMANRDWDNNAVSQPTYCDWDSPYFSDLVAQLIPIAGFTRSRFTLLDLVS